MTTDKQYIRLLMNPPQTLENFAEWLDALAVIEGHDPDQPADVTRQRGLPDDHYADQICEQESLIIARAFHDVLDKLRTSATKRRSKSTAVLVH
jgi:hypothetical protein